MLEKLAIVILVLATGWILSLPAIERWREERGVGADWVPTGQAIAPSQDAFGRTMPVGACALVVMSECEGCSFKNISRETVLEEAKAKPVIVVFQDPISKLPADWREPSINLFLLTTDKVEVPVAWLAASPFLTDATARLENAHRITIVPEAR